MKIIFDKVETPSTIDELVLLIKLAMMQYGNNCDLNFIDVSQITDLSYLFSRISISNRNFPYSLSDFNGDISGWDVSNVTDMSYMFCGSEFNSDISQWKVSKVTNMDCMFNNSKFNQDISQWDVSSVSNMSGMFCGSDFQGDVSNWDISTVVCRYRMFDDNFIGKRPRIIEPLKVISKSDQLPLELWLYSDDHTLIWSLNPLMNPKPSYTIHRIPLDGNKSHTVEHYARFMNMDIKESPLSTRAKNIIENGGLDIGELILYISLGHLHIFRNMGPKSIKEIYDFLRTNGVLIDLKGQDRWKIF